MDSQLKFPLPKMLMIDGPTLTLILFVTSEQIAPHALSQQRGIVLRMALQHLATINFPNLLPNDRSYFCFRCANEQTVLEAHGIVKLVIPISLQGDAMNNIIWWVGFIVILLVVLGFFGLR